MINESSVSNYHVNKVIPNVILANKEFFLQNIIRNTKNMEYFITKDTYKKACNKMGVEVNNIKCHFTANVIDDYFVVFVEFLENNNIKAIAFATKNNTIRYFTYDEKNMVGEWKIINDKVTEFISYQKTNSFKVSLFAGVIASILKG